MDEVLMARSFLAAQQSPGGWLLQALSLRSASQRLDWNTFPAIKDEYGFAFIAEYHLLLGLAFENLLKGYITLVRLEKKLDPPFPRECYTHRLEELAGRPECQSLELTAAELTVLSRLSPYVEWKGKYPLPKKAIEMSHKTGSTRERDAENALWLRLVPLLKQRAWIMKGGPESMGGYRLYIQRPTTTKTEE